MFLLILSLLFNGLQHSRGTTGLQRAGALIKEPLNSHKQTNDVVLTCHVRKTLLTVHI